MRIHGRLASVARSLGVAVSAFTLSACGDSSDASAPKVASLQLTVSPDNVLAYQLAVDTDQATTVSIKVTPKDTTVEPWTVSGPSKPALENEIAIAGLRAESEFDLEVTVTNGTGQSAVDTTQSITTDPLPDAFPPLTVDVSDPARMAPGNTLLNVFSWLPSGGTNDSSGWLVVLDPAGKVIWYANTPNRPEDSRLLADGHVGYSYSSTTDTGYIELDALSHVSKQWVATHRGNEPPAGAIPVDIDAIHHEVFPLPNGNFLTLSSELRSITQDQCPNYPDTLNVVGDVIVEFSPAGEVVHQVSEFDFLDPCRRIDHDFIGTFWNAYYGGINTADWTHSNAAIYDAERKLVLVSIRHQDWVVALHWPPTEGGKPSDDVAWIFGDEGTKGDYGSYASFTPDGKNFAWQYHQHAPEVLANGDIMLFDNGNLRPGTNFDATDEAGDGDLPYSRVVQYHIDTADMTVSQVFEAKALPDTNGDVPYCPFVGDANTLGNGNVLGTFGGAVTPPSDAIGMPAVHKFGRIVELAQGSSEDAVFDITVRDTRKGFTSYNIYRSTRAVGFPR